MADYESSNGPMIETEIYSKVQKEELPSTNPIFDDNYMARLKGYAKQEFQAPEEEISDETDFDGSTTTKFGGAGFKQEQDSIDYFLD